MQLNRTLEVFESMFCEIRGVENVMPSIDFVLDKASDAVYRCAAGLKEQESALACKIGWICHARLPVVGCGSQTGSETGISLC